MLKGTLDDFTLPDMFRLMSFTKKTGRLDVERRAGQGNVFFRDGEVYYAESSLTKIPLGQKLLRAGVITEGQLNKALDRNAETGDRVGQILIASGAVTEEELEAALKAQIEDAIFDLLRWDLGEFSWEPDAALDPEVSITVSVENLIMEASRRLDELEVITRKIPSGRAVLAMAATPPEGAVEINITPEEWRIMVLVDGRRTVSEIGDMVGLDEFDAMRTLYGLVSAGLVEVATTGEGDDHEANGDEREVADAEVPTDAARDGDQPVEPDIEAVEAFSDPVVDALIATPEAQELGEALADFGADASESDAHVLEEEFTGEAPESDARVLEEEFTGEAAGPDALDPLGIDDSDAATEPEPGAAAPAADWFEDPVMAETSFDEPAPGDLAVEAPTDDDPLLGDLLDEEPLETAGPAAAPPPAPERPTFEPEPEPEQASDAAPEPPADARVDRAAVVRELAGLLGDETKPRPRPTAAARPEQPDPAAPTGPEGDVDQRKRVEDDDQMTRGLISRLIDGVKGL